MGTHLIPRDVRGEGRILYIFSYKALIYTGVGLILGFFIYKIFDIIKLGKLGLILLIVCAAIGFFIGTFKMPNSRNWEITKKTGGEKIDEVILRWLKFKKKKNKIYINTRKNEEENNG